MEVIKGKSQTPCLYVDDLIPELTLKAKNDNNIKLIEIISKVRPISEQVKDALTYIDENGNNINHKSIYLSRIFESDSKDVNKENIFINIYNTLEILIKNDLILEPMAIGYMDLMPFKGLQKTLGFIFIYVKKAEHNDYLIFNKELKRLNVKMRAYKEGDLAYFKFDDNEL